MLLLPPGATLSCITSLTLPYALFSTLISSLDLLTSLRALVPGPLSIPSTRSFHHSIQYLSSSLFILSRPRKRALSGRTKGSTFLIFSILTHTHVVGRSGSAPLFQATHYSPPVTHASPRFSRHLAETTTQAISSSLFQKPLLFFPTTNRRFKGPTPVGPHSPPSYLYPRTCGALSRSDRFRRNEGEAGTEICA